MTPQRMAQIYRAAFADARPWTPDELAALCQSAGAITATTAHGFAIGRVTLDEAELITIAVEPQAQGRGEGADLLGQITSAATRKGARLLFLEVASDNTAALAMYLSRNFEQVGIRARYYPRPEGKSADALVLQKHLRAS